MGRTNTGSILRLQDMPPYDDQMIPGLLTCVHMTMGKYHRSEGIDPIGHKPDNRILGKHPEMLQLRQYKPTACHKGGYGKSQLRGNTCIDNAPWRENQP